MLDADGPSWIRLLLAFASVLALMAALGYGLKYMSLRGIGTAWGLSPRRGAARRRLELVEALPLDARRRLVIVRCDEREHLLLLSASRDIVVETNLPPSGTAPHDVQAS